MTLSKICIAAQESSWGYNEAGFCYRFPGVNSKNSCLLSPTLFSATPAYLLFLLLFTSSFALSLPLFLSRAWCLTPLSLITVALSLSPTLFFPHFYLPFNVSYFGACLIILPFPLGPTQQQKSHHHMIMNDNEFKPIFPASGFGFEWWIRQSRFNLETIRTRGGNLICLISWSTCSKL